MPQRPQIGGRLGHVRHLDHGHAGRVGGAHTILGILERKAGTWVGAQEGGGLEVDLRIGLGPGYLVRADDGAERTGVVGLRFERFRLRPEAPLTKRTQVS